MIPIMRSSSKNIEITTSNKPKTPIVRSIKYQLIWLAFNSTYVLFIKTYNVNFNMSSKNVETKIRNKLRKKLTKDTDSEITK